MRAAQRTTQNWSLQWKRRHCPLMNKKGQGAPKAKSHIQMPRCWTGGNVLVMGPIASVNFQLDQFFSLVHCKW